jgi:hypothetical protein
MIGKVGAAVAIGVAFFLSIGCSSGPAGRKESEPLADSASVILLSEKDLRAEFGWNYSTNPFIAPAGTVLPKAWDFIVAKLDLVSESGVKVELLQAEADDKDGVARAWFYDRSTFADFAASVSPDDQSAQKRRNVVNWNYLPSKTLDLKRGSYGYILVFMGKHPIPDSLVANIRLMVNGEEKDFSLPAPAAR